jgi:hypothetical protein
MVGFQKPVYAVAPSTWYCSRTQALGRLLESSAGLKPEYENLVAKLDNWFTASRQAVIADREKPGPGATTQPKGYGVFRFANLLPSAASQDRLSDPGDFVNALYLHFLRTGDFQSLELAEETLGPIADAGLIAEEPLQMRLRPASPPNSQPNRAEPYGIEELVNAYLFSGNRRSLETALSLAGRIAREERVGATAVAQLARQSTGLMKVYEATGDRRWLEAAKRPIETLYAWQDGNLEKLQTIAPQLGTQWRESFKEGLGKTALECAIAWSALERYQRLSGDRSVLTRMERSAQWLYQNANEWSADTKEFIGAPYAGLILAPGLAALYEETSNTQFLEQASHAFQSALQTHKPIDDPGVFGSVFRAGQYLPWFFSKEFQSKGKRDVSHLIR